jgi:hypothetical protein
MPRFYFHVSNASGFTEDQQGREMRDLKAAHAAALQDARAMMAEELMKGEIDLGSFIEIEDENHKLMFTLTFHEAVSVKSTRR